MGMTPHPNDHLQLNPAYGSRSSSSTKRARDADEESMIHTAPSLSGFHRSGPPSDFGPQFQREVLAPPRTYGAPPPLAPYVTAEHRVHPPRIPSWGTAPDTGVARYHANPHPHRPPPIQKSPRSAAWRSPLDQDHSDTQMRSPSHPQRSPTLPRQGNHARHPYQPASVQHYASSSRLQLPPLSSLPHVSMQRSISHESRYSNKSVEYSRPGSSRPSSGESSGGRVEQGPPSQGQNFERRRRTRALMTRLQTAALRDLWRRTKFPGNVEREEVGTQIGLTPRQVQVWFQNQRQKARKEIDNRAIPDDAHPQDYVDLDKSPRSRRLSIEAHAIAANTTSHGTADSITSSERSAMSSRSLYYGYGVQTPRDDASSTATVNSARSAHFPSLASGHLQGDNEPTSALSVSRDRQSLPASTGVEQNPFAFHMVSPLSARVPSPSTHQSTFSSGKGYPQRQRDDVPSVPLPQQSPTYPIHRYERDLPQPQPMRHAATVDGEMMYRRRSNSLEGVRPPPIRTSLSPPRPAQNRARTQTGPSALPPSLASLVLAGPVGTKPLEVLPRFAPEQRAPTLPPPRGWPSDRREAHVRSHTDPIRPAHLPGGSQLPGYRAMFGPGETADPRR